jgi:polysaccharide export outer membrane protein
MMMSSISCEKRKHWVSVSLGFIKIVFIFSVLLNGCATLETKPEDAQKEVPPVSKEVPKEAKMKEFILGPGDKIEISVYRHDDLKKTVQIDFSGKITYPFIGDIEAGGLSIPQLRNKVQIGLSKYIVNPDVSVNLTSVRSQSVVVLGEVRSPGSYNLDVPLTSLQVISMAGGFTIGAKQETVLLIRGGLKKPELITLNFKRIFNDLDMTQEVYLQNGDIIYVPITNIENVARFFDHLQRILAPFAQVISGVVSGANTGTSTSTSAK